GSGKTRLALEIAWRQIEAWADGVWLADLTAVADPELVAATVAAAVGLRDDCEHLVDACAEVVRALVRSCPNVCVLATSRMPLRLPAERDYALDPLAP